MDTSALLAIARETIDKVPSASSKEAYFFLSTPTITEAIKVEQSR